ncbi:14576_t:CDS:2 [Cetraspora pellucida]|uniref:14576_t:CDS:1 n=1 Tax=Cetraspora pellucida TaxID=1433469 RepID=A0A9N9IFV0_9GLOM|nr:14576_t:CDS:2 [Cetraspora pellucida]
MNIDKEVNTDQKVVFNRNYVSGSGHYVDVIYDAKDVNKEGFDKK